MIIRNDDVTCLDYKKWWKLICLLINIKDKKYCVTCSNYKTWNELLAIKNIEKKHEFDKGNKFVINYYFLISHVWRNENMENKTTTHTCTKMLNKR